MRKRLNPPCIRGLQDFKKGCPLKPFDNETGEGCYAWIEITTTKKSDPKNPISKEGHCVDLGMFRLMDTMLRLQDGTQSAVETLTKNISTEFGPKPDPVTVMLFNMMKKEQENRKAIMNYETRKIIDNS